MKVTATVANPVVITGNQSTTEVSIDNTAADGDPIITLKIGGVQKGSFYVDDSDSDKVKISSPTGTIVVDDLYRLFFYRRPALSFVSVTTVDVENNTGTANETRIIFPDGTERSVTEDTASTNKYRRFIITAAAEFTSGTEDSGLRSGLAEATDTWYAIYAVKSTINTANFVLAGDTTLPSQANFATLNTRYGTNGWVYLGMIRNGDASAATGDILSFYQSGIKVGFANTCTGQAMNGLGLRLATSAGATTLTYTYAAGTGTAQIPAHIVFVDWNTNAGASGALFDVRSQVGTNVRYHRTNNTPAVPSISIANVPAANGLINETTTSTTKDIYVTGFYDPLLIGPF
jgi:hypothetical protein